MPRSYATSNGSGSSALNFYTETPSGTVDDSNTTFTTVNTITTILTLDLNGQFLHPVDYTVSHNTITFTSPLGSAFAGLPFTIVYIGTPIIDSFLLLQDGSNLLLQDGSNLLLNA